MHEQIFLLPPPSNSSDQDNTVGVRISVPKPEVSTKTYGRDLNTSDLLLLGAYESLQRIMFDEYGIGGNCTWEYPESFSTTSRKVILDDGNKKYFVKEKPKYCCTPYSLSLAAQFQELLAEQTDFVPRIIPTKSGSPYLQLGSTLFFTTEFVEGRMFNGSINDVESAGATLGRFHHLSQEFSFPNPRHLQASGDALQFVDLADQLNGAQDDIWRGRTVTALRGVVDKYKGNLDENVPYIVNHGDYAPFNLVYDLSGNVVAVNDFDNVNYRPRTRDLAGAILSFCDGLSYAGATSTLRKPIATSVNKEKVRAFITGYETNSHPLSESEKADLIGELSVRWVKIMALGIVRGDFNYEDVFNSLKFVDFIEEEIPKLL